MSMSTLIVFAITGGIACTILGLVFGRLLAIKGLVWSLKDTIGIALIGAFVACLFILFWKAIPPQNEQLIVYMLGQLSGFVGGVVLSHYGSKAGEEKRSDEHTRTTRELVSAVRDVARAAPGSKSDENVISDGDAVIVEKDDKK
jgi:membrane associated rhomboid family serine protease